MFMYMAAREGHQFSSINFAIPISVGSNQTTKMVVNAVVIKAKTVANKKYFFRSGCISLGYNQKRYYQGKKGSTN